MFNRCIVRFVHRRIINSARKDKYEFLFCSTQINSIRHTPHEVRSRSAPGWHPTFLRYFESLPMNRQIFLLSWSQLHMIDVGDVTRVGAAPTVISEPKARNAYDQREEREYET